jgi:outer membrane lipoprotein carrier protein
VPSRLWRRITGAVTLASVLALNLWPATADADNGTEDATDRLLQLLQPVKTMQAEFQQTVLGARYQILQEASGRLYLSRPLRFRWEVDAPYEQLVVTAGNRLYIYDPDLDQVNVEPLDEALRGTPALILAGTRDDIEAGFDVMLLDNDRMETFQLTPRAPESLYSRMRLRFDEGRLVGLEIVDALDQRTEVVLTEVRINEPIDPERFTFEVPPNADVIGRAHPTTE